MGVDPPNGSLVIKVIVQRGSAFVVLRIQIRTMFEQHAYDLNPPITHRHVQHGRAAIDPRIYVCTMLKQ